MKARLCSRSWSARTCLGVFALLLSGCGAGTAAVAAGLGDSSDPPDTPPTLPADSLEVFGTRFAPAVIRFRLIDAQSQAAGVEILVSQLDGSGAEIVPPRPIQALVSGAFLDLDGTPRTATATLTDLATAPDGFPHWKLWDFAAEPGIELEDETVTTSVIVRIAGTSGGAQRNALRLGDAPPRVLEFEASGEGSNLQGIVPLTFRVQDSEGDRVRARIEYQVLEGTCDWVPARPANLSAESPTPEFAFRELPSDGEEVFFFWDTLFAPPAGTGACEVRAGAALRTNVRVVLEEILTPDDQAHALGAEAALSDLLINNNLRPIAFLDSGDLVVNSDRSGWIPIRMTIEDGESESVLVVPQWESAADPAPELPSDRNQVLRLLSDPAKRREYHVASQRIGRIEGSSWSRKDVRTLYLEELKGHAARLHSGGGLAGYRFNVLSPRLTNLSAVWSVPHAVVDLDLDDRGVTHLLVAVQAGWELVTAETSTGEVTEVLGSGAGTPAAMARAPGKDTRVVLATRGSVHDLFEVDSSFQGGWSTTRLVSGLALPGPLRDVAVTPSGRCLLTAGDALLACEVDSGALFTLLRGLRDPWGIALDPARPQGLYLAERGLGGEPGRLSRVDLRTLIRLPLFAPGDLVGPTELAVHEDGSRLVVAVQAHGSTGGPLLLSVGFDPQVPGLQVVPGTAPAGITAVGIGPGGRFLAAANRALFGHRVATWSARIESATNRLVSFRDPLPPLARFGPWSIEGRPYEFPAGVEARRALFLWDADRDLPFGESVTISVTPFDSTQAGTGSTSTAQKAVGSIYFAPATCPTFPSGSPITPLDLDRDGDLDLVGPTTAFANTALGFVPTIVPPTTDQFVDLDGDGFVDSIRGLSDRVEIRFGVASSPFFGGAVSLLRSSSLSSTLALSFAIGEVTGDTRLDVLVLGGDRTIRLWAQGADRFLTSTSVPLVLPALTNIAEVGLSDTEGIGTLQLRVREFTATTALDHYFEILPPTTIFQGRTSAGPVEFVRTGIQAQDLDRDGLLDYIVDGEDPEPDLFGFITFGFLYFGGPVGLSSGGWVTGFQDLSPGKGKAFFDIEQDGVLEMASGNGLFRLNPVPGCSVFGGCLQEVLPLQLFGRFPPRFPIELGDDLDGDGRLDLLGSNACLRTRKTLLHGGVVTVFALESDPTVDAVLTAAAADLDGDGLADVQVILTEFDGAGDVTINAVSAQSAGRVFQEAAVQCNLIAGTAPNVVKTALGDLGGNGIESLSMMPSYNFYTGSFGVTTGDIDGDEADEAIRFPSLAVDGSPCIQPGMAADGNAGLCARDIDSDGVAELVMLTNSGDVQVRGFTQGKFPVEAMPSRWTVPALGRLARLEVVDLDRDGRLDLVASNGVLHVVDVNEDELLDLVFGDGLAVFFGLESGFWEASPAHVVPLGTSGTRLQGLSRSFSSAPDVSQFPVLLDLDGDDSVDGVDLDFGQDLEVTFGGDR